MNKRLPEFTDIQGMERFTGGDYCEAKNLVAYASNQTNGIILKNLETGAKKKISVSGKGEGNPSFSRDGSRMLFLSAIPGGGRQLFVYNLAGGDVKQITHIPGAVMEPIWSPDGRQILFSAPVSGKAPKKSRDDEPVVIEDFGYKFDGLGYIRPDSHMQLYVIDSQGGEAKCITEGQCDFLHHNWTPDSRHVICISDKFRSKEEGLGYDLLLIDAQNGQCSRLTEDLWLVSYPNPVRPVCTPDGRHVIAAVLNPETNMEGNDGGYPEGYLFKIAMDGSGGQQVFRGDEKCYQCVQFPYNAGSGWGFDKMQLSEDGSSVFFVSGWQGQCNIYKLDMEGDGHAQLLAGGKQVYHGLSRVQNGKMMVCRAETTVPEGYYIMDLSTGKLLEKAAQSAEDILQGVYLSKPEDFFFKTLDGESRVHGWVLPPQNRKEGEKYPTILYIHGGPHPFYTYGLTMEHQCFAAAGFGVICCNPRGSSGYGWTHQNFERAMDGSAYTDCMQLVDEAVRRFPWVDGDRLGATGGSYGGYMTNYIATHSKRFKAYISQRSMASELIGYASTDMQGRSKNFDSFEEFMVNQLKASTVSYAERIDRPFLILHGIDDYRCPVEGAHQLYVAIKDIHPELPVKMVLFPHTSHEQPEEPRLAKAYYREMVDWFNKYLQQN